MYKKYKTYECYELYAYFYELAVNILSTNGILSFITASLWVKGLKFNTLRVFIENNTQLLQYKNQGDDVFRNVNMPTSTIICKKGNGNWNCSNLNIYTKIVSKIEKDKKRLYQISQIQRGLEIGRNEVFENGDFPCITGTLVNKYYPRSIKYISKLTLEKYAKEEKYFTCERILLRETGSFLTALYSNEHLYSNRSLYSIIVTDYKYNSKYVLACLNSSLLQFFYEVNFKADTDVFPKIRIAQAKQLPIPSATPAQQQPIIDLVDTILAKKQQDPQADTTAEEQQIDLLVYRLYDLTYDEILIIDPATPITKHQYEHQ